MVTTRIHVDVGSAAELGAEGDKGGIEETTRLEILDQGREGHIELGEAIPGAPCDILVHVPAAGDDLDDAYAVFNELPREEAALPQAVFPVFGTIGFVGDVEGGEGVALEESVRLVVVFHVGLGARVFEFVTELLAEFLSHLHAPIETLALHDEIRVRNASGGIGDRQRAQGGVHETGVGGALANEDGVREDLAALAEKGFRPRSNGRVNDGGAFLVAGAHDVFTLLMRAIGRRHRVDHRHLVTEFGKLLEVHAELHVVHIGVENLGGPHYVAVLLRIEGVEMGHAPREVDVDEVLCFAALLRLEVPG